MNYQMFARGAIKYSDGVQSTEYRQQTELAKVKKVTVNFDVEYYLYHPARNLPTLALSNEHVSLYPYFN
jgi:hypothetical protein